MLIKHTNTFTHTKKIYLAKMCRYISRRLMTSSFSFLQAPKNSRFMFATVKSALTVANHKLDVVIEYSLILKIYLLYIYVFTGNS
jgi:hypothetical protein